MTAVRTYSANGTPIAERSTTAGVSGSVVKWLATDAQNSATLEVGRVSGVVTRRYTDPFGNTRGTAATWSSSHGFLNKPADSFTGLDMVGARQYDAGLGRFTSVDAVLAPSDPQQNNGYSYAANNPVTLADPSGDCYNARTDSLSVSSNCAGGHGITKADAAGGTYQAPAAPSAAGNVDRKLEGLGARLKAGAAKTKNKLLRHYMLDISQMTEDPAGRVLAGWLFGISAKRMYYGTGSGLVQQLRKLPRTTDAVAAITAQLKSGSYDGSAVSAGYDAGAFSLNSKNFRRDLHTYTHWGSANDTDKIEAALGSYPLNITASEVTSNSAMLTFQGNNGSNLGSALAWKSASRPLFDLVAGSSGPTSYSRQFYSWTEKITW